MTSEFCMRADQWAVDGPLIPLGRGVAPAAERDITTGRPGRFRPSSFPGPMSRIGTHLVQCRLERDTGL